MNPGTIGLIGGIAGSVIGVLGGLFGTYRSVRNTTSPAERSFVIKAAIIMWALLLGLVGLPLVLSLTGIFPRWGYWPPFVLFFILLGPFIRKRTSARRRFESSMATPPFGANSSAKW